MEKIDITLDVNNKVHTLKVRPNETLLEVLREQLDLTGAKEGCGEGVCGSCTIQMDGNPVRSCLTLAIEAEGTKITTVEGLAQYNGLTEELTDLQESFIRHGAVQCGFCTSGMVMSADALLKKEKKPDEAAIRKALAGNICRCTGYAKIIEAVSHATSPHEHCCDCQPKE